MGSSLIPLAPGVGIDVDGVAGLGEAIDERGDAGGTREDGAPLLEREVGGDDGGPELMATADDVVEDVAAASIRRQV